MVFTAVYRTTDWRGVCVSTDRVRPHGLRPVQLFGGDSFSRHHWWIDSSVNSSVEFILWHVLTVWCRVYFTGEYQMKVRRQCGFLKGTDCNYTHSQTLRPRLRPGLPPSLPPTVYVNGRTAESALQTESRWRTRLPTYWRVMLERWSRCSVLCSDVFSFVCFLSCQNC